MSKVKQVIQDLTVEKDKGGKASRHSEEESHLLEEVESKNPGGFVKRNVRRLVRNFQRATPNRHVDHSERVEDAGRFVGQEKEAKKQRMRLSMWFLTPESDSHYSLGLIP